MNDCEAYGHPNVTGAGCPCGHVVTVCPPPSAWPREPEMLMHLARQPQRKRTRRAAPTIPYRPRRGHVAPRVQRLVYP